MKARLAVGLVALAALAVAIPLWDGGDPVPHYQGYVTGDFVHVGPVESGRVDRLAVERGSKVAKGDPLFGLDTKVYRAERDQAVARLRRAEAQLAKLRAPRQQAEEIDVLEAREEQAEAALAHSKKELDRQRRLRSRDVSSAAAYDKALARYRRDRAAMKEIRRQIRLGKMPARAQNIEAAIAAREDARAALNRARERLERRRTAAPVSGIVQEVLFRPGEVVEAGRPVVTILPPGNLRIRFWVPEPRLSSVGIGNRVEIACDGCPRGLKARIAFVADEAEYTPPMIFSPEERRKFVYRVEAEPEGAARPLKPGQPVTLTLRAPHQEKGAMPSDTAVLTEPPSEAEEIVIDVRDLTKSFDGKTVVEGLTMQVRRGQIYGFLGPNGSGKTTTIRMLCGLLTPDGGSGTCLGLDIRTQAARIKRRVGYMTQRFSLYEDLTIRENLEFVARIYELPDPRAAAKRELQQLGLTARADQRGGTLSGGWKQRLALGACILRKPDLLLLDEPTAGVDPKARRDFWDEIHRLAGEGLTVLTSTHYMDEAERCHEIAYLAYGRLLARGTIEEVVGRSGLTTWIVAGEGIAELAGEISGAPGVDMIAPFGNTLHVSGRDADALNDALAPWRDDPRVRISPGEPSLEDVFIDLMGGAEDNFR